MIDAIIKHDFASRGISLTPSEVFISDGAKSDTGNIGELLRWDNSMAITDPVYPVYVDSNIMCGRSGVLDKDGKWNNVTYLPCTAENDFIPDIPDHRVDLIYLCYPNNPTGTTLTHEQLKKWVDYALANDTLIVLTPPTRHTFASRMSRTPSMRYAEPKKWLLKYAVSQKQPVLPEYVAAIR